MMNLVVIVSDTFRWDYLKSYGNDWIETPHLDKLAGQSAIFDEHPDVVADLKEKLEGHMQMYAPLTKGTTDVGASADAKMSIDCRLPF